ncbi:MAG: GMC family oxidoreductase, partial [Cyclobacteriaceae bacterium]|nr:GMC family oxidoreductase [Cyclobacteriaceae bacterium]
MPGFTDQYYYGRNPSEPILANFRNLKKQEMDFVGGYTTFAGAYRTRGNDAAVEKEIGVNLKNAVSQPGGWKAFMYMQGETIPKETNQVRLSPTEKDQWGIPLLITNV